jgi:hypothetical protein
VTTTYVLLGLGIVALAAILFFVEVIKKAERADARMRAAFEKEKQRQRMEQVAPPDDVDDTVDRLSGGNF